MFAHIKTQVENPQMSRRGFELDQTMHLHSNFHKLALTRGSSYIKLSEWIAKKKVVINSEYNDEQSFKWAVVTVLHNEYIKHHPEKISFLQHYEDRCNWQGSEFSLATQKIGNNTDIELNVLFNSKKGISTACKSKHNGKGSKQTISMMTVDVENRHYTAIKNISRLLQFLNPAYKGAYHFCMNCLNGFHISNKQAL